ncbi:class I SAM-dependent methyltransferase [Novispirillum sp. DQ9]|uniref:class I SAM-dependent methyltransferase n=1 Tax=Novispirillum sp. DQ9 TaxID=3398612 RepID=UPI003C7B6749
MSTPTVPPQDSKDTFHAARARRYDDTIRRVIPGYDSLHAMGGLILRQETAGDAHVLVVGCGTGAELGFLGAAAPGWRFTACDPAEGMLEVARARVAAAGLAERVALHACSADGLPAGPPFDAATCLLVLHFVPDDGSKLALLRAIAARLKPGAPLLLADMYEDPRSPRYQRLVSAWAQWQIAQGIDPVEVDKGLAHVRRDIHFVPEARLAELLAEAGFGPAERFFGAFLFGGYITHRTTETCP